MRQRYIVKFRGVKGASGLPVTPTRGRRRSAAALFGYDETLHAFEKSTAKLGVEQIDLGPPAIAQLP